MEDYQRNFLEQELLPLSLDGKRLLEIGAGHGEVCRALAERAPAIPEVVGINIEDAPPEAGRRWRIVTMDATRLDFPDASFDIVYSLASFEHIQELSLALSEIRRVLRPSGLLVSVWSPIWNGFNGHHYGSTLSHPDHRDIALPWAHHLLGPERLPEYLVAGESFSAHEAERAVEFIYRSPWLNRLGYRDYRRILENSGLAPLQIEGVRVDFPGLLLRVHEKLAAGHLQPEELIAFFKRLPPDEILVYKLRIVMQR